MRFIWSIAFILLTIPEAVAFWSESPENRFERSLVRITFDQVDLAGLSREASRRGHGDSDEAAWRICERNLTYVYHHKLNRQRFLVAPRPQDVADQIAAILQKEDRLNQLIREGRELRGDHWDGGRWRTLVSEIEQTARELKSLFSAYFVEAHSAEYSFRVPTSTDPLEHQAVFLGESRRISNLLGTQLDDYFLSSSPGAVDISHFRGSSILTLATSMERLARLVSRRMPSR